MKILLVYPEYPDTFWSFKHALSFVSKKAAFPPLGLLTIAAMLPEKWDKKLVDMNVSALGDKDIQWADYVFISAMITQKAGAKKVIDRCNKRGTRVVAGGPIFTTGHEEFSGVDHFVLGEAETILPQFLRDIQDGCAKRVYASNERPDITHTPIPMWELINIGDYVALPIQYSRGCPYDCEFCDIIIMNGRVPRAKTASQFLRELNAIYETGFRGSIFLVDDNFIGNKTKVKKMLPQIAQWQKSRQDPFRLLTEASLNLADDEELMKLMIEAGFDKVFVGLETPNEESLEECNKLQNEGRDMVVAVKKIQNHGMQVLGGYIVGFDNDPPSIFDAQIAFIQKTGVVVAMVGLLDALPKTRLYERLKAEGRLLTTSSGNNTDLSMSFSPKMGVDLLMEGYKRILKRIYSPKEYCERIVNFFKEYKPPRKRKRITITEINAFAKSIWRIGITGRREERRYYWKLLAISATRYRSFFSEAIVLQIYGFHFRKVVAGLR
ncbi:MAG: DUF4070 domain-containing protein [bacterium]|nr:DUF4070 domain-containing protein [bacterium]